MDGAFSGFDWDKGNRAKCQKHGVSITEIEALFLGPLSVVPDPDHSHVEARFKAIGRWGRGRYVFLVFTIRRRGARRLVRPISARYMHQKEIEHYGQETDSDV